MESYFYLRNRANKHVVEMRPFYKDFLLDSGAFSFMNTKGLIKPNFDDYVKKIYTDFKSAVNNYLTNKNYNINLTNFGKAGIFRFVDSEIYKTEDIEKEINLILMECITKNLPDLKQRTIETKTIEKQFTNSPIDRLTLDTTNVPPIVSNRKIITITPGQISFTKVGGGTGTDLSTYKPKGTFLKFVCVEYTAYAQYSDGNGGTYEEFFENNSLNLFL